MMTTMTVALMILMTKNNFNLLKNFDILAIILYKYVYSYKAFKMVNNVAIINTNQNV